MPEPAFTYTFPVSPGRYLCLTGEFPVTAVEWERFHAILDLFAPGLIEAVAYADFGQVEDGFGSSAALCRADCAIEVVRPGKFQCVVCEEAAAALLTADDA